MRCIPLLVLGTILVPCLRAQTGPKPPVSDSKQTIHMTTREVLLDLVVRDKHERLVENLQPEEVEVYEDGVKQTSKSFKTITGKAQTEFEQQERASGVQTAQGLNPLREINLVSIVFSQMSTRSRDFARQAVLSFLKNQILANTFAAVYSLDYKLNALQVYTSNQEELAKAAERASRGTYSQYAKDNEAVLNQIQVTVSGNEGGISITPAFDPTTQPDWAMSGAEQPTIGDATMMQAKMISDQRFIAADTEGIRPLEALLTFVRDQRALPGRKTVLFLGEGLPVPPERPELMESLISEANRANVTFYAIDVRGLSTHSTTSLANSELRNRRSLNTSMIGTSNTPTSLDSGDQVFSAHIDDSTLLAVHADSQLSMRALAESTGGFLVANTNNIEVPMRRIMEDVRTHYELAYTPSSTNYDGHFRKIEVKLLRPGLKVQTRSGYYALPDLNGAAVQAYEVAAMGALNSTPLPHSIDYRASLLDFGPVGNDVQCIVAFQVPKSGLRLGQDADTKKVRLHASLLALIKNAKGQIVGKVSRDLNFEVPPEKAQELRDGDLIYSQSILLRPGRYTMESVALDREGDKAGVKRADVEVDKPEALGLSSISLVRRVEPASGPGDQFNPLQFKGGKVVPSLTGTAQTNTDTALYFVLYPPFTAEGKLVSSTPPVVTVQFFLDGKEYAEANPPIRMPEEPKAIPVFLSAKFNPGEYMVTVKVQQGPMSSERSTAFRVQ
ncbi:MAG: VWA domain-containing protein [Bryobacteraceae bacterium]